MRLDWTKEIHWLHYLYHMQSLFLCSLYCVWSLITLTLPAHHWWSLFSGTNLMSYWIPAGERAAVNTNKTLKKICQPKLRNQTGVYLQYHPTAGWVAFKSWFYLKTRLLHLKIISETCVNLISEASFTYFWNHANTVDKLYRTHELHQCKIT